MNTTQKDIPGSSNHAQEPPTFARRSYLLQAWLMILLALVLSAALAGVQLYLGPRIAANAMNEIRTRIPRLVPQAPGAADKAESPNDYEIVQQQIRVTDNGLEKTYPAFRVSKDNRLLGWVVKASGQGYADRLDVLIGLPASADRLSGVYVLNQKETPGLGAGITEADWLKQFRGKPLDAPLEAVKTGANAPRQVDAVTGATVSSQSVCRIINRAVAVIRPRLAVDPGGKR